MGLGTASTSRLHSSGGSPAARRALWCASSVSKAFMLPSKAPAAWPAGITNVGSCEPGCSSGRSASLSSPAVGSCGGPAGTSTPRDTRVATQCSLAALELAPLPWTPRSAARASALDPVCGSNSSRSSATAGSLCPPSGIGRPDLSSCALTRSFGHASRSVVSSTAEASEPRNPSSWPIDAETEAKTLRSWRDHSPLARSTSRSTLEAGQCRDRISGRPRGLATEPVGPPGRLWARGGGR